MKEIINWLANRIYKQNKNNLIIVVGETGSGKSQRAIKIGYDLTKSKTLLWHDSERAAPGPAIWVVFSIKEFFHLLSSGRIQKGDVVIWEEGGVGANSRNWYTQQNKLLNFAFQTMRHRNFTLIMTLPSLADVDSALRKLFHLFIECQYVDFANNWVRCKVMRIQHNPRLGKTYFKYFRIRRGNTYIIAENVYISAPPPEMVEQYEPRKMQYTKALYKNSGDELKEVEERSKNFGRAKDYTEQILDAQKNIKLFIKIKTKANGDETMKINPDKIRAHYKISIVGARTIAENLKIPEYISI